MSTKDMIDSADKIERWRMKATEARNLAHDARNALTRIHLLKVVETYELVANAAEMRLAQANALALTTAQMPSNSRRSAKIESGSVLMGRPTDHTSVQKDQNVDAVL
jgi:hypothetical protein